jgi:type II secretory pathway pseudopilin PulG
VRKHTRHAGYTLIEIVVALLVLTIGELALAATSAIVGRDLRVNSVRERAARIAASRLEILVADCHGATSGHETLQQIESNWSVGTDSSRVSIVESVAYNTPGGWRTDTYRATLPCPE